MVNSKLIAIAYFCFFMSVYLSSIAYSMIPSIIDNAENVLPQTSYTTDTRMAISGIASTQSSIFAGFGLIAVGIIIMLAFGMINMFGGYGEL